jgi:hypothetical protein
MKASVGTAIVWLGLGLLVGTYAGARAEPAGRGSGLAGGDPGVGPRSDLDANVASSNDRFNGTWKVDWPKSHYIEELKSRKSSPQSQGPYGVKQEIVTLTIANNTEHCINDLTFEDGTRSRSEYTATYNDGKWYPSKNLITGQVTQATVMMFRIEPGRELRLSRNSDGKVSGFVLRTVTDDGSMRTMNLGLGRLYAEGTRTTDITLIKQ